MARQIIILETNTNDGGSLRFRCVFWYPIAAGKEIPLANFISQFKTPTTQEATDLQAGKIAEEVRSMSYPKSFTATQIKGALVAAYNDRVAYRATLPDKGQFYGLSWDGTAWA